MIGYPVDFSERTITLPNYEITGARNLVDFPRFDLSDRPVTLRDIQELRGNVTRWNGANDVWRAAENLRI